MSVGGPESLHLKFFAKVLYDYFGEMPYQVGSSIRGKKWRDVDLVVMVSRERLEQLVGDRGAHSTNVRWAALCAAFSSLGCKMTGLPIDFKLQEINEANEQYKGPRDAIGMRFESPEDFYEQAISTLPSFRKDKQD